MPHFPKSDEPNRVLVYNLCLNTVYSSCIGGISILLFVLFTHVFHHGYYSIEIVEERNVLVTSSSDCAVRLWTLEGQYIGKAC